ncbi:unnamed protein product [Echinostoma caproni]|uniref:CTNNB1_binding domain-containing protein n=1 Tax=Echinostoma caproni TaxID=27848 RepID=A0A183BFI8_9TREM|nr:unnamed protein product [Echinostoma caproni]
MWLRSAPADESKQPMDSASSPSGSLSRKTHGGSPEKTATRDITLEPPEQSKQIEPASSTSAECSSPAPPQLDRASSIDSVSMPSQLSTAATTPDPQSSYYHGLVEPHFNFSMPTLRVGSHYDGVSGSDYPSHSSSGWLLPSVALRIVVYIYIYI